MTNVTQSQVWQRLEAHHRVLSQTSLQTLFAQDPQRFERYSLEAAGLFIDFSKNWIDQTALDLLLDLATEQQLSQAIDNLFTGAAINTSEQRPALHTALRLPASESLIVNGVNVVDQVQQVLKQMAALAEQLQAKQLLGYSGKPIDTVLHVGVGGSDLGPATYYRALRSGDDAVQCHFMADFDFATVQAQLAQCNPETTLVVVVSKSFGTKETLTIANTIKVWLSSAAGNEGKIREQFYAVTANADRARGQGYLSTHILPIWDWVGGRFSVWSAVSFSMILTLGITPFKRFLAGAYAMDQHFHQAPLARNLPVLMALLALWYNNFFQAHTKAVVPYSARLSVLPHHLQQLHMESLGKCVSLQGEAIDIATGRVMWGNTGPNSQHSFHQLFMQGSELIPVDFILPLPEGETLNHYELHRVASCLSQSQTMLDGYQNSQDPHKAIQGGRPSTTIIMESLTPESLGALMALYEHKVFVQAVLWNINPFDQWGVERGKQITQQLIEGLSQPTLANDFDASTRGLLDRITRRVLQ